MRTLYRFFLLLAVGLLTALSGCGEDETPSLATYPDNNFSLVAEDGEGSEEPEDPDEGESKSGKRKKYTDRKSVV